MKVKKWLSAALVGALVAVLPFSATLTADAQAQVMCNGLPATMVGTLGDDTLIGTPGPDVIHGLEGNDTIDGLGGNDTICGGIDNDVLIGGFGNDTILGGRDDDHISGGGGDDVLRGLQGDDEIYGGRGDDVVNGARGDDRLFGDDGECVLDDSFSFPRPLVIRRGGVLYESDCVPSQTGDDMLMGGEGNDVLDGGPGSDVLLGGAGEDLLGGGLSDGRFQSDVIWGGSTDHADIASSNADETRIGLGLGDDHIHVAGGNATIFAGAGDDTIRMSNNEGDLSTLFAGAGNDWILLGTDRQQTFGEVVIFAGDGDDRGSPGGTGQVTFYGGAGDDRFVGDAEHKPQDPDASLIAYGGAGNDFLAGDAQVAVELELYGGAGDDRLISVTGGLIFGQNGNDVIYGGDTVRGGADNDLIHTGGDVWGEAGDDLIISQDDIFTRGRDPETVAGGNGNDQIFAIPGSGGEAPGTPALDGRDGTDACGSESGAAQAVNCETVLTAPPFDPDFFTAELNSIYIG